MGFAACCLLLHFPSVCKLKCETHVLIPFHSFPGCESSVKVSTSLLPPSGLAHCCRYIGRGGVFQGEKKKGGKKRLCIICVFERVHSLPVRLSILLRVCVCVWASLRGRRIMVCLCFQFGGSFDCSTLTCQLPEVAAAPSVRDRPGKAKGRVGKYRSYSDWNI